MNSQLQDTASDIEIKPEKSKEVVCSGAFQYRWNYADYEKAVAVNDKKHLRHVIKIVTVIITSLFALGFISMVGLLMYGYFTEDERSENAMALIGGPIFANPAHKGATKPHEEIVTVQFTGSEPVPPISLSASLGMSCEDITERAAAIYRLPMGILVKYVNPDYDVYAAGLTAGDIIVKVGEANVQSIHSLDEQLGLCADGDIVTLGVYRNGTYLNIQFKF